MSKDSVKKKEKKMIYIVVWQSHKYCIMNIENRVRDVHIIMIVKFK